jgi:hypothetical protein
MRAMRDDSAPSSEDWLSPREISELLDVPLRTVVASFTDSELRARWWELEVEGRRVAGWRTKPLVRRTEYQARRWAVDRLAEHNPAADQ